MTEAIENGAARRSRPILRVVLIVVAVIITLGIGVVAAAQHGMNRDTRLRVGATAPDFTLQDQTGTAVTLSAVLEDHRGAIVAFYPKDFTPG